MLILLLTACSPFFIMVIFFPYISGGIQGAGKVQGDLVGQDPETAIHVRGRGRIREGELHEKEYPEMWRKKENPETKSLRNLNHLREG